MRLISEGEDLNFLIMREVSQFKNIWFITGPQHRASKSREYYINEWMIHPRLNRK